MLTRLQSSIPVNTFIILVNTIIIIVDPIVKS